MSSHENPNFGATDRWLTPLSIVRSLGDFDLDPCGESFHITAKTIWTQNGLERDWFGRVWLNPPYSEVGKWVSRLAKHGHGVALVFARMDTKWAQDLVPMADSVFFPRGRLKFTNPDRPSSGNAGAPSMFLSFGENPAWQMQGVLFEKGLTI